MSVPDPDPYDETPGMSIWGWMHPVELRWLVSAAEQTESVVQVGCLHGRSAYALLTACPGPVYCIDPWDDPQDQSFASFMRACGDFPNLRPIRGWSPEAAAEVPGMVDMVFLDGAHSYEAVLTDISAWLPKTRMLICGHDYEASEEAGFPGVARAVDTVFNGRVRVGAGTSIWYVNLQEQGRSAEPGAPTGPLTFTDEYGRTTTTELHW